MNDSTKQKLPLILGLSIPVAMIALIAAFIYIPFWTAPKPAFDFLYMSPGFGDFTSSYYPYDTAYQVKEGRLVKTTVPNQNLESYPNPKPVMTDSVRFFIHRTLTNQNEEVSFQEAEKLRLISNLSSPDGFEVVSGSGGDMFIFGSGSNYNTKYLKGHGTAKKIDLTLQNYYDFRFLGWVQKN